MISPENPWLVQQVVLGYMPPPKNLEASEEGDRVLLLEVPR
jgi:hypothetical protein